MARRNGLKITFTCPNCKDTIVGTLALWWHSEPYPNEIPPIPLGISSCDSSGIYDAYIRCPMCDQTIDIMR